MLDDRGRDTTCIAVQECTVFILEKEEIASIKTNFRDIFKEMSTVGIKRHKKHQIIIAKFFNRFLKTKQIEKYNSDDDSIASFASKEDPEAKSDDDNSSFKSYNSEKDIEVIEDDQLEELYRMACKKLDIGKAYEHKIQKRKDIRFNRNVGQAAKDRLDTDKN